MYLSDFRWTVDHRDRELQHFHAHLPNQLGIKSLGETGQERVVLYIPVRVRFAIR